MGIAPVLTIDERKKFDEIVSRAKEMVEDDTGRDEVWTELEKMYLLNDEKAPQNVDDYLTISMKPRLAVDQVQDILCNTPPSIVLPQLTDTETGRKEAERVRTGLQAIVYRAEEQGDEILPQLVAQGAIYGVITLKVLDRRRIWKWRGLKPQQYEDEAFPFAFIPVHPASVHARRVDDALVAVVQQVKVTGNYIHDFFGEEVDWLDMRDSKAQVTLNEYWDREWQCIWIDHNDAPILGPMEHKTRIPFCIRNVRSARFLGLNDRDGQSMLRPLYDSRAWRRMNLLLTVLANNAYHMANQSYVAKTRDGKWEAGDVSKPGATIPMFPDESLEPLRTGNVPEVVKLLQMMLEGELDLALIARVASGNAPGGVTAGFAVNILSQAARTKINSIKSAAERCYTDALLTVMSYIRQDGPVSVWGQQNVVRLEPKDFKDKRWHLKVSLSSKLPQDRIADTQVAMAMKNLGVSEETIYEDVLEMSAETELERRWLEQFRATVAPLRMMKMARKKGYAPSPEEEMWLRQKVGLETPPPQPGQPGPAGPGGGGPPPLVGPATGAQGNEMQSELMQMMASRAGRPPGGAEQPEQAELAMPASQQEMA